MSDSGSDCEEPIYEIEVASPVNIALVKYWGKRDVSLILPFNDSISLTLDENYLGTRTVVRYSTEFVDDEICLNGKDIEISERLQSVIDELRRLARKQAIKKKLPAAQLMKLSRTKFQIKTKNLMPTAAGLASSASGLASIAYGIAQALKLTDINISQIARLGSGSACRSISGGLVQWYSGEEENGSDSRAEQIYSSDHWPELCFLVLVVSQNRKKIGSTAGMQKSLETSSMMNTRNQIVDERIKEIKWAFSVKNFESLAEVTMRDSNMLHAICQDTYPPIFYLNETSHALINFVTQFNQLSKEIKLAYTFDAGPNCFLLMEKQSLPLVSSLIKTCFLADQSIRNGISEEVSIPEEFSELQKTFIDYKGEVEYAIQTNIGSGSKVVVPPFQV